MDRNSTIGFILITVVLVAWIFLSTPQQVPQNQIQVDTISQIKKIPKDTIPVITAQATKPDSTDLNYLGTIFTGKDLGNNEFLTIESDRYIAKVSKKGGNIFAWQLKNFLTWDGHPVQLVNNDTGGDLNLLITTTDGKLINTKNLFFEAGFKDGEKIVIKDNEEYNLDFTVNLKDGKSKIVKSLKFKNGQYSFFAKVTFVNLQGILVGPEYQLQWENHLKLTEQNSVDEASFAYAYAMYGDELIELDGNSFEETNSSKRDGVTKWISSRNKYFTQAIIPRTEMARGYILEGKSNHLPNEGVYEKYLTSLKVTYNENPNEENNFEVFIGPSDYDILKSFDVGLQKTLSLGLDWLIRPISEYFMLPLFKTINLVIPNWGFVIVIFTLIIRILLHPLNKKQMDSMQKMQALQPMINENREKYKDDPQKMNAQMLRLYREYGVNPAGGCLPLLLQMPILYALWAVFRSAIELRQASFIWWIKDLSVPDTIFTIPFKLPLFGMDQFSGLALLMGITMFIQQKMSVKDPRQKAMIYMMPILFTLMFNSFPAGLNLYYFLFNLLSIAQQFYMTKIKKTNIVLQKVPVNQKKGFWDKIYEAQQSQKQKAKRK